MKSKHFRMWFIELNFLEMYWRIRFLAGQSCPYEKVLFFPKPTPTHICSGYPYHEGYMFVTQPRWYFIDSLTEDHHY